jgi:hypothetical protein
MGVHHTCTGSARDSLHPKTGRHIRGGAAAGRTNSPKEGASSNLPVITLKFTLAILVAVLSFTGSVQAGLEAVYVKKVIDSKDEVIIQRRNGEVWLLEYGIGRDQHLVI